MKLPAPLCAGLALTLAACGTWPIQPINYGPSTPVPSGTPWIQTVTPFVVSASPTTGATEPASPTVGAIPITPSETPTEVTPSPTLPQTASPVPGSVNVAILGCDTSIDVLHGMGEVTNAYVTISNSTASDVTNVCATLSALDEGRPHPDKTKCLPILPPGYQVTLKLTVDTTYRQSTPIQVDLTSGGNLLMRVGEPACKDIGLLLPGATGLGVLTPIP